ncbi:DUF4335 domain-containing protein [Calothrix membranacea FACHB-236]|nr:DUF4335 domain-containing protein [Calothrix membranacea FACHB-236]
MPLSNSVIRRYTPPTCTLEVLAQSSPLSRWTGKTVLKQLSFELRFDDPRLPEESRLPIRGDRDQLEALCDAVSIYIQQFLQQSPETFSLSFPSPQDSSKVASDAQIQDFQQTAQPVSTQKLRSFPSSFPTTTIYLEPSSSLTHKLFLGSLASQASGPVIELSLLQLFDLGTALDEYSADIMALPTLENTGSSVARFPVWAPVAAVLVLGVGLLPVTWQYVNNIKPNQQQTAKKTNTNSGTIALQPSPQVNPEAGLAAPDSFPPLPNIGSTTPIPTSSLPADPLLIPNSGLANKPQTLPNSNFPSAPTSATSSLPKGIPSPASGLGIPQKTNPTFPTNSQFGVPPTISDPQIALQPNLTQNKPGSVSSSDLGLPKRRELPPSLSTDRSSRSVTPNLPITAAPLPVIPNETTSARKLEGEYNPTSTTTSRPSNENALVDRLRESRKTPTTTNPQATDSTLFDTPQIAEARQYLQKRWQPPSGLRQTLEYSVMVGVDGTVERIFPLNKAARDYVDSAGMPNIGTPFVSANRYGRNVRLRAVLSPDGKVQIFPETE